MILSHTVYHVPADKQMTALKEIHRILKPTATGVVIDSWGNHSLLMRMTFYTILALERLRSLSINNRDSSDTDKPRLYSYTHSYRYIKNQRFRFDIDVVVWSSISSVFTKTYIPGGRFDHLFLKVIWKLEETFPHFADRFGQYLLFITKKTLPRLITTE